MLEVNDFDAIRISIASPEQVRSWSHGEVTKPETINYRTLKPEKDGLFCEKIFGPTKDWECYCGKYKRVRYKGIICDKCGVEVARSKVRRERMGHIELAAPVSHIWYVKGIPSRLGLLLNLSPRNLERVLYFALFIVTDVDEEKRQRLLEDLDQDIQARVGEAQRAHDEQVAQIRARVEEVRKGRADAFQADFELLDRRLAETIEAINAEAAQVREILKTGAKLDADLVFSQTNAVVARAGDTASPEHLANFEQMVRERLDEVKVATHTQQRERREMMEAENEQEARVASEEIEDRTGRLGSHIEELYEEGKERRRVLDDLHKGDLLSEGEYRERKAAWGDLFQAGMGAEAVYDLVAGIDLDKMGEELREEIRGIRSYASQRRKKATKRLRVVEAFRKSGARPEWMVLTVLPVIPPDLRPMVQLDGGRFATSDLNDLYRRVINRNNRLKRLMELNAPEIIIRNEKRMLQEAVDALIDNGRRGRAVAGSSRHKLKSLSDMLKGKQGRFRQNLLGKRVDYSGRSVIVVGPDLKLHQCGLPKKMALELFKPFVMRLLVQQGFAHNIKSAKRIVERERQEVWDVLEEVIRDHPVMLNRAPTLHRLGIQAFEAVLIEGSAIQIHPLVCPAFNADFDGDQMAVHVPLSRLAQREAMDMMLSSKNLLSPANGDPIVSPQKDIVLGCYYMTLDRPDRKGPRERIFSDPDEMILAHDSGELDLQMPVKVRMDGQLVETTVGRVIFNNALPPGVTYRNQPMDRKALRDVVGECYVKVGAERTAATVDRIKDLGFHYATKAGITVAISDFEIPTAKDEIQARTNEEVDKINAYYKDGAVSEEEKHRMTVQAWTEAREKITDAVAKNLDPFGSVYIMAVSGASKNQFQPITQLAGMRGLMADPQGRIIDLPILSNFREGLSVLEYFISTHGARKGLADTALRTADSGYLTRRLVDVSQDVIVNEEDCGTTAGIYLRAGRDSGLDVPFDRRLIGRTVAEAVIDPNTAEIIVDRNEEVTDGIAKRIIAAKIQEVSVRSPLTCQTRYGICQACYGRMPATGKLVEMGEAVGIIAAQSIGEPGTQLTMRTFHTGGVAGESDITQGLPRVEELFEARVPKGQAVLSEIDGVVEITHDDQMRKLTVTSSEAYQDEYDIPAGYELLVTSGDRVEEGRAIATRLTDEAPEETLPVPASNAIVARTGGDVTVDGGKVLVHYEEREQREYVVPPTARLRVAAGERIHAGQALTEGSANPQDILRISGREAVQLYLGDEVQRVYRSQGVTISDKHIEVIVRQLLRRVMIESAGDTEFLPGELVDRFNYEEKNAAVLAEGGEPATAQTVLLGVTKAALNTDSFLSAASFQDTTRVLTEAAVMGAKDKLRGLKENVIIGKLIPAGTGFRARRERARKLLEHAQRERELEELGLDTLPM